METKKTEKKSQKRSIGYALKAMYNHTQTLEAEKLLTHEELTQLYVLIQNAAKKHLLKEFNIKI